MSKSDTVMLKAVKDEPPAIEPMPDDLEQALAKRRPWTNRATKWIAAAVLVAGGFAGGIAVQQQWGATDTAAQADSGAFPDMSAMGDGGFPGGEMPGGFGGQATTGTVTGVDGTTVTIETEDGTVVTVETGEDTAVTSSDAIDLGALAEGDTVTVTGETADDGTVTADALERTASAE
ncbi:hypothetical protein AB0A73_07750 [Glycomyces sp. NPDC047369]